MSAEKVRIYDLAKKLKLPNKEVMDVLEQKLNIKVKSHASTIDQSVADQLSAIISSAKTPKKVENEQPKQAAKPAPERPVAETVKKVEKPAEQPKKQAFPNQTESKHEERRPEGERPFNRGPRPEGGRPFDNRGPRPEGGRPFNRGPRPEGGRPFDNRGPRPEGERPFNRGPRPEGGRPFDNRGPRPEGGRPFNRGPRPEGGRPFDNRGPRPEGERPFNRGPRPEGGRPFDNRGPRPEGERPFNRGPRPEGGRPFDNRGPRPEGGRPFNRGPRPEGGRPFENRGPRPEGERSSIPTRRPVISREAPSSVPDFGKSTGRRDSINKKKEKYSKDDIFSKEEKLEHTKLLQSKKKQKAEEKEKEKVTQVFIDKPMTVGELSNKLDISVSEVIKELMMSGMLATVNQTIDVDSAKNVAKKLDYTLLDKEIEEEVQPAEKEEIVIDESKLKHRAPVVTIMGHVDHGKTTLLDAIRSTKHKIVNTEVGGITQSIGAYTVRIKGKKIVFLDTPGHEAFTAMRARGAQSTDIAVLVVAADDGIMPQTIEAISHAKAAKVPIIIAVNKIDKAGADPDKVLQQLTEYDLIPEKWGGDTVCVQVSALQGTNIDELLEYITLVAELEDLKADPNRKAGGVIIEARLDKGRGPVATLLVQSGTLKVGDYIVAGNVGGKVRALLSDEGERLKKAGPSTPVEILGLTEVPQAGDRFEAAANDKEMKNIVSERKEHERTSRLDAIAPSQVRKEMILQDQDLAKDLNIIIKANTHGSAEAVSAALQQLSSKQIFVKVVHIAVGDISEADVMLASASNAIIIGFSVKEDQNAIKAAAHEGIDIRKYDIIYQILEDIEKTMLGLLQPEYKEIALGQAEVRQVFTVGKTVKIAGCYVTEGKVQRNKTASVLRDGKEIFKGPIDQLKRFKDDVKEVAQGFECGISFDKFNDILEGDIIKVSTMEEIERETLV